MKDYKWKDSALCLGQPTSAFLEQYEEGSLDYKLSSIKKMLCRWSIWKGIWSLGWNIFRRRGAVKRV
jgi:hypothetical protein